jgi:hypothetical protein
MRLGTFSRLLVIGLPLLLLASTARAQQIVSPYRFIEERQSASLFLGYVLTNPGDLDLGPQSGFAGGGRYGIRLSGPFVLEGTIGLLPTTRMVMDTIPGGGPPLHRGDADLNVLFTDAALRFDVTGPRTFYNLLPFLTFGGGASIQLGSSNGLDDGLEPEIRYRFGTSFAGQFGAGVEWLAWRPFGLRADVRNMLWRVRTPRGFLEQDPSLPTREWTQNFLFSLGVSYRF